MQTPNHPIAHTLAQAKSQAMHDYAQHREPRHFFRDYVAAMETALCDLWQHYFGNTSHLALLATGGLGRRELYPHSDLDLAIVSAQPLNETEKYNITQFIQKLWDMKLSPAVKSGSLKELCESAKTDLTADTAFLESRHLSGCLKTAENFQNQLFNQRDTVSFIEGKLLEMKQRHAKQPALMLEPNVKNSAGGLRDVHTMMWLAKVQNLRADFVYLRQNQVINHIEAGMLRSSYRVLARLRIELHILTGREEDRLLFDLQQKLSENEDNPHRQQAMEQLMRKFYRASKNILQLSQIIIPMLQGRIYAHFPRITHQIDEDYYQINHQIAIKNKQLFEQQPEHIFKIIQILQASPDIDTIAPQTLRAWWTAVQKLNHDFYENEQHRAQFLSLFQMGDGLSNTMRLLNVYGLLGKYFPAWDKIVGLLQHDLFHIYPVDDHILVVLRNMRRLARAVYVHELPLASDLMQRFDKPYILYLAAWLHDIAKGRNGDHAVLGAQDAQQFAHDHRLPEKDGELLAWLVEQHLLFSQVAQKQDIHDPHVIQKFCETVNSNEKLSALYLLTIADIRGTNPKIWNTWKAQLLETLFQAASRYLAGEQHNRAAIVLHKKQQAFEYLKQQQYDDKHIRQLWQALGEAYFVYFDDDEIQWQLTELIQNIHQPCVSRKRLGERLHILVYMPNQARLFTRICRLISQHGLDILSAKAWVTAHGFILDEFVLQLPETLNEIEWGYLEAPFLFTLNEFAHGRCDVMQFTRQASRRARLQPISPRVLLTPDDERADWYILDIVAVNRPALLADITEVFARHQVRLYHARIATLADRVEDSFLIHCPTFGDTNQEWAFQQDVLTVLS